MLKLINKENIHKGIILLFMMAVIFWTAFCGGTGGVETSTEAGMRGFTLILWSILLEALPFVLLGTVISSLIQVFVTEEMILKVLPKNNFLRMVVASLFGLVFPVCECAIIPITRGLLKKGLPTGPAIAFMIATPIVNPIVLLSTFNAFPTMPQMVAYRAIGGFVGAVLIGLIVSRFEAKAVLKDGLPASCGCGHSHDHADGHDAHGVCGHHHEHAGDCGDHQESSKPGVLKEVLAHTSAELQNVGMYLIFGAVISASMQMLVPTDVLTGIGGGRFLSIAVMMLLAFVLSLCSEADAFIGSTFLLRFSGASVLAFLITGPMIDIKNTLMMLGSFKKKFVMILILTILLVCFALAVIASFLMGGSYA